MTAMTRVRTPGRGWAYTGAILGGLVSIAANIAHSFIPPHGAPTSWAPEPGAVVGAIVWPVFLFAAVEIFARVVWPYGWSWRMLRWGGLLPVAAVAAFVSYRHLSGLLAHYGEEPIVYYLGPLAVDGLMVMATGALLATGRHRRATLGPEPTPAAPPAGTVASPRPAAPTPTPALVLPTPPAPAPVVAEVPTPAEVAARITPPRSASTPALPVTVPASATRTTRPRQSSTASRPARRSAPSTTDTPVTASDAARPTAPVASPDLLARAGREATAYRAEHGTPITPGQLAIRLRVPSEQAGQLLAVLNLDPNQSTPSATTVNGRPIKDAVR